ncbi:High-affinity branched-chain amino acid transport ATP-binding protein LivF [bacterium HR07]|uniref:Branched-chain amino acid transport system ATP-binding protein n=1 Tax=Acetithermum autotrophicum TaxID=1446466 RepID=H5SQZ2_ACEAU|nr:branched-chain amino acid transport system ATP-binding protein [Candidatus Acetothermum autotrophicum]GBC76021.1 High-affinity branched-chain amino acid transport ATP-binding protein LivF [bacterium HR07]
MLKLKALEAGYGPMQVLWGPNLEVRPGTITALLGPNGAGKSTALKAILGTVKPWRGQVTYNGRDVTHLPPHQKVATGIVLVPEGRHLFVNMTVHENLMMGAYQQRTFPRESLELVYALFPILRERAHQRAGTLSGGEQQMLTIARGLMARPQLMMLDEPSQGLAPKLVAEVFTAIERLNRETNLTILLVEQNVEYALTVSDYAYIMHEGRIKAEGSAQEIRESELREIYLGI